MNDLMIKMSLIGSSSSLGLNWIYDRELMKEFSEKNKVLFLPIQHKLYEKAEHGFDVYPNHQIGDLDFMGEVAYLFHTYLKDNIDIDLKQYVYNNIGPTSTYDGYIEKYGKVLIDEINNGSQSTSLEDTQLIGPTMYIIGYAHGLTDNDILHFTKVFTIYEDNHKFHKTLNYLFKNLEKGNKKKTLAESISFLPSQYQESCKIALTEIELFKFIDDYSGVACGLEQSFPLVYYIVSHSNTFVEALVLNSSLGGASSARGILIGAIYSQLENMPRKYESILNKAL